MAVRIDESEAFAVDNVYLIDPGRMPLMVAVCARKPGAALCLTQPVADTVRAEILRKLAGRQCETDETKALGRRVVGPPPKWRADYDDEY